MDSTIAQGPTYHSARRRMQWRPAVGGMHENIGIEEAGQLFLVDLVARKGTYWLAVHSA